jgi:hypothetical protein
VEVARPGDDLGRNPAAGKLIRTLTPSTGTAIATTNPGVAFSPDGGRIACEILQRSGATAISVFDTESGKEVLTLTPPRRPFGAGSMPLVNGSGLTFSPDGHRLLLYTRASITTAEIDGKPLDVTGLHLHTWDATPLPEPKQP